MTYIATLTLDYTGPSSNEYTRLVNAICQCPGWDYVETSAMVYEAPDLDGLRLALEVLARAVETPRADLSALGLQVQFVGPSRGAPNAASHRRALERLIAEPLPSGDL